MAARPYVFAVYTRTRNTTQASQTESGNPLSFVVILLAIYLILYINIGLF